MGIYKNSTGKGEDIVIFHGAGAVHQYMQPVVDQLSGKYCISNYDSPGRGKSTWNPSIETVHDIADEFLPHLPSSAIYIGWSFGGLIAMSIAARYPERVKKIIGVTTSPKFIEDKSWSGFPKPGFIVAFEEIKKIGYKLFMKQYYNNEFPENQRGSKAYHDLLDILHNDVTNDEILINYINMVDSADLRKEFTDIQCPIELILGGKGVSVNINSVSDIKALNSRANIHIIPEAQHMVFWTHQKEFNKALDAVI